MYVCTVLGFLVVGVGLGCRSLLGAAFQKGRRFPAGYHATCVLLQNLCTKTFVNYLVHVCMYVCMYVCIKILYCIECMYVPVRLFWSEEISICSL